MKISFTAMLLLCLFTTISFAQTELNTTSKRSEFGISIGFNTVTSSVTVQGSLATFDQKVKSKIRPGFSLGVMYRYRLNDLLVLRIQPELSFSEAEFYRNTPFGRNMLEREMINLDFPLHLVFEKANKKVSPSVSIGGRYRYDLGVEKYDVTDANGAPAGQVSLFREDDVLVDLGLGMAFKMEHFSFKPAFVYSRGLLNQSGKAIDMLYKSVYSNQFSVRFLFYGA